MHKQRQKHTVSLQRNQTGLCDYRQKMYFHVSCQSVGWYGERGAQRVWWMLGSLNQAVVSLADRLYINVIHQAAFTNMTSVAQWGLAGHSTHIKHLLFSVRGIKRSALLGRAVCLKGTCHGKWSFDFNNKYLEKEYHWKLHRERTEIKISLCKAKIFCYTVIWYIRDSFLPLSLKWRNIDSACWN